MFSPSMPKSIEGHTGFYRNMGIRLQDLDLISEATVLKKEIEDAQRKVDTNLDDFNRVENELDNAQREFERCDEVPILVDKLSSIIKSDRDLLDEIYNKLEALNQYPKRTLERFEEGYIKCLQQTYNNMEICHKEQNIRLSKLVLLLSQGDTCLTNVQYRATVLNE